MGLNYNTFFSVLSSIYFIKSSQLGIADRYKVCNHTTQICKEIIASNSCRLFLLSPKMAITFPLKAPTQSFMYLVAFCSTLPTFFSACCYTIWYNPLYCCNDSHVSISNLELLRMWLLPSFLLIF